MCIGILNLCVYDNGKGVKIEKKKNIFTILVVVIVVVVVQFNTHNSLTGLVISTKLCEYIDFHIKMCIGVLLFFVNNVVLVKQQQTASGNTL